MPLLFRKSSILRAVAGPISVAATSATMIGIYRMNWPLRGYAYVVLAIAVLVAYLFFWTKLLMGINRLLISKFAADELKAKTEEYAAELIIACFKTTVFDTPDDDDDLIKREAWQPFKHFCE